MMKKLLLIFFSTLFFSNSYSQDQKIEIEIRKMEEMRTAAFLAKDTSALLRIWSTHYTVNRPAGVVSTKEQVLEMVLTDTISFTSMKYEIEQIIVRPDFVISMGNETVIPTGNNPNSGKTLKRRYTHIWANENGKWRLLARHANILCQ